MSDNDDLSWILQSGKAVNDRRAKLGLPLDGNFDHLGAGDNASGSKVGSAGSILGSLLSFAACIFFWFMVGALWLMWEITKVILSAIFSSRR